MCSGVFGRTSHYECYFTEVWLVRQTLGHCSQVGSESFDTLILPLLFPVARFSRLNLCISCSGWEINNFSKNPGFFHTEAVGGVSVCCHLSIWEAEAEGSALGFWQFNASLCETV